MLTIRFQPIVRKHSKFYRVVVAEKQKFVGKKFIEILGWYNPNTKEVKLEADRVKHYIALNTETSSSVQSLFKKQNLV